MRIRGRFGLFHEWTRGARITTDLSRLDLGAIHGFLKDSYWARGVPRRWSNARSRTRYASASTRDEQAGFARVTTDRATFLPGGRVRPGEHRGRGLGKWLMEVVLSHPGGLEALDARRPALQAPPRYGFQGLASPEIFMERTQPTASERAGAPRPRSRTGGREGGEGWR